MKVLVLPNKARYDFIISKYERLKHVKYLANELLLNKIVSTGTIHLWISNDIPHPYTLVMIEIAYSFSCKNLVNVSQFVPLDMGISIIESSVFNLYFINIINFIRYHFSYNSIICYVKISFLLHSQSLCGLRNVNKIHFLEKD